MDEVVVILDVRSSFYPFVESAKTCIKTLIHGKMVYKPRTLVGVVIFGSDCSEVQHSEGIPSDAAAEIPCPLQPVSLQILERLNSISGKDTYGGSLLSAIKAASDMMEQEGSQKRKSVRKKLFIFSTFVDISENERHNIISATEMLVADGVSCEFLRCVDERDDGEHHWIDGISKPAISRKVHNGYELKTCFPTKENKDVHVIYSGSMNLGGDVEIRIKIVPKTKKEGFPVLGNTSEPSTNEYSSPHWSYPSASNSKADELYREDDIEQANPLGVNDRVRGFKFGKSLVPLSESLIEMARLSPERSVRLLGFLDAADVSPDLFLGTSKVLFADKVDIASVSALYSLACAMSELEKVALLRVVLRAGGSIKMMIAFPSKNYPSYFVLKEAPYTEDIALLNVIPLLETNSCLEKHAQELIDRTLLAETDLVLDKTSNPTLHRAISYLSDKFLDSCAELPKDNWLEHVFGNELNDLMNQANHT